MRKGVSPVVATVLLIAIAVISAVAVWYWVAPLTSAQPTPATSESGYTIGTVYKNVSNSATCVSVDITNNGGVVIPASMLFEIRYQGNGTLTGKYLNTTLGGALTPGSTLLYNISSSSNGSNFSSVPLGTYLVRPSAYSGTSISGFGEQFFTC